MLPCCDVGEPTALPVGTVPCVVTGAVGCSVAFSIDVLLLPPIETPPVLLVFNSRGFTPVLLYPELKSLLDPILSLTLALPVIGFIGFLSLSVLLASSSLVPFPDKLKLLISNEVSSILNTAALIIVLISYPSKVILSTSVFSGSPISILPLSLNIAT